MRSIKKQESGSEAIPDCGRAYENKRIKQGWLAEHQWTAITEVDTKNDPPLVVLISSILQQEGVLFHCLFSFKQSPDKKSHPFHFFSEIRMAFPAGAYEYVRPASARRIPFSRRFLFPRYAQCPVMPNQSVDTATFSPVTRSDTKTVETYAPFVGHPM